MTTGITSEDTKVRVSGNDGHLQERHVPAIRSAWTRPWKAPSRVDEFNYLHHMSGDPQDFTGRMLAEMLQRPVAVRAVRPVGGGCINNALRVESDAGLFFIKTNSATRYPGMFEAEVRGLALLRVAGTLAVPRVAGCGRTGDTAWIAMEWIEPGKRTKDFFAAFGSGLAKLHGHTHGRFGLDHDNYIGSLKQPNTPDGDGASFFIRRRLAPQVDRALQSGRIDGRAAAAFDKLYAILPDLLPDEPPALLHGDLWSGNFMTGSDGRAVLIDPAVFYGFREADVAMTLLFGGFDEAFYEAYQATRPLAPGWRERTDLLNLYPLLVHVNLFGGGYAGQVMRTLRRFV